MAIEYTKTDVTSGYNLSKLNKNFTDLEIALDDGLSRTGQSPNQMEADIDLNDNDLLNVKTLDVQNISYQGETIAPQELVTTGSMLKSQYDPNNIGDNVFDVVKPSVNRASLKAFNPSYFDVCFLEEAGRQGIFKWTLGDFSTQIASDTLEGIYIKANTVSASVGAWIRQDGWSVNGVRPEWFGAQANGVVDDVLSVQAAINTNLPVRLSKADYKITAPLIIKQKGQSLIGVGGGGGATHSSMSDLYSNFIPQTRIIASGTAAKRVMTRRLPRLTSGDPNDSPMSAVVDVEAEYVQVSELCIWLDINPADTSPSNLGSDWDIGLFVGTRLGFKSQNLVVVGYFRRSSVYFDASRAFSQPPQLLDYNGVALPSGVSGGDGCTLINPVLRGGRQGLSILGGIPTSGGYYDSVTNQVYASDGRGRFGYSDFTCLGGYIGAGDHHSGRRLANPTPVGGVLTQAGMEAEADNAPAALYIDGMAGNSSGQIWNMSFFNTRISTSEMFRRRLRNCGRIHFYETWSEGNNNNVMNTSGTVIDTDDYTLHTYGSLSGTTLTGRVQQFGRGVTLTHPFFPNTANLSAFDDSGRILATEVNGVNGATLAIKASGTNNIGFDTGGSRRWNIFGSSGTFSPGTDATLDIGSSGSRVKRAYFSDRITIAGVDLIFGAGIPEGVTSAPVNSMYINTTASTFGTWMYRKNAGTGNTGWVAAAN